MKYHILLASGSPRRRELMDRIGSAYICIPSNKEEDMSGHDPKVMVEMLSAMKAGDIADKLINGTLECDDIKSVAFENIMYPGKTRDMFVSELIAPDSNAVIIGCDTVVAFENKILGKPKDEDDAAAMIKSFAGKAHHVHTGVCILVIQNKQIIKKVNYSVSTAVNVVNMSDAEISCYVMTGEPMDKAGAYAIQGLFCPFIESIEGDYYNIVGFPICSIYKSFKDLGINIVTGVSHNE
ncbi:MAG: Maf family protein [Lachnospiraceae bacterium]|nr:septum formation protein Maf [Lachnospiraceae bacterium]MCR5768821.1 Maf family protein [Lachnospiraceae bacterium]